MQRTTVVHLAALLLVVLGATTALASPYPCIEFEVAEIGMRMCTP